VEDEDDVKKKGVYRLPLLALATFLLQLHRILGGTVFFGGLNVGFDAASQQIKEYNYIYAA